MVAEQLFGVRPVVVVAAALAATVLLSWAAPTDGTGSGAAAPAPVAGPASTGGGGGGGAVPAGVVAAGGTAVSPDVSPEPATARFPQGDLPGWHQVYAQDFTRPAPLGTVLKTYGSALTAYDQERDTTGRGLYDPDRVLSVSNGVLDWWLHSEGGQPLVSAVLPSLPTYGQTYGRYSVRFRADPVRGYKTAFLLWPDSERWPDDGEIDFPEGNLDGHFYGASQLAQPWTGKHQSESATTQTGFGEWHTATTEWTPGRVEWFVDGKSIGAATVKTPTTSMHWVLQVETSTSGAVPAPEAQGHVQVDWVAAWSYDPATR